MNLVETLGAEIGVRQAGTPEAARAAEAVAHAFAQLGLDPLYQEFSLLGYDADEPELEIDGERWDAGPCIYAHPTDGPVEGTVRWIGTTEIGEFFPPAHAFVVEDANGHELARLYASPFGGPAIPFITAPRQIVVGPTVFIGGADADRLRERDGAHARVHVKGRFVPGRRERNVIAEQPGESDEAVVVSAHFDSVWRGPGVIDNATGIEGIRRVAERLRGRTLPRAVIYCAFAAEEIGLIGARNFVFEAQTRGQFERIKAIVNLDCIAHGDRMEVMASPDELRERARAEAKTLGLEAKYDIHYGPSETGVDAYPFTEVNVPAVSILHFPYPEYHLPEERLELVDEQKLADCVDLAVALVESIAASPPGR
ncbi:MAG: M28 family metallopeptidase [Actinomycetota bacterium]|nr:M28 family metallopeptidase [Actinomycetota bacterium]